MSSGSSLKLRLVVWKSARAVAIWPETSLDGTLHSLQDCINHNFCGETFKHILDCLDITSVLHTSFLLEGRELDTMTVYLSCSESNKRRGYKAQLMQWSKIPEMASVRFNLFRADGVLRKTLEKHCCIWRHPTCDTSFKPHEYHDVLQVPANLWCYGHSRA